MFSSDTFAFSNIFNLVQMQRPQMWKELYLSYSRIPTFHVLNQFSYLVSFHTSSFVIVVERNVLLKSL